MLGFWNDPDGFSIKDLYGIVFCSIFAGITLYALIANDPSHIATALTLLQLSSPVILTILGGYALSEGAKGVVSAYNNRQNTYNPTPVVVPYSQTTMDFSPNTVTTSNIAPPKPILSSNVTVDESFSLVPNIKESDGSI